MTNFLKFPSVRRGIVCFTFDDRNFEGWLNALPLFEKYNAHATFFISGEMDSVAISAAQTLFKAGHTIGLHTKNHQNAPEYFQTHGSEAYFKNEIRQERKTLLNAGIPVTAFSYPNNKRTGETDAFLGQYFSRFRAGVRDASDEKIFVPAARLSSQNIMYGFGIGEYYNTTQEDLNEKICRAARENVCITFFSHNICQDADHIHMDISLLEKCLCLAHSEGVLALGFNDLTEVCL